MHETAKHNILLSFRAGDTSGNMNIVLDKGTHKQNKAPVSIAVLTGTVRRDPCAGPLFKHTKKGCSMSTLAANNPNSHYLSVDEAASILGVHHTVIRRMINAGQLDAIKVGRLIRIPSTALAELPPAVA